MGGLSYIGGRLSAPVSGDEGKDKEVADKAKANVNRGADKLSNAGQEGKEKASLPWSHHSLKMLHLVAESPVASLGLARPRPPKMYRALPQAL